MTCHRTRCTDSRENADGLTHGILATCSLSCYPLPHAMPLPIMGTSCGH